MTLLSLLDNLFRDTIDTRVYRGSIDGITGEYDNFEKQAFELAEAFSRSPHFEIIDSYTNKWWSNRPYDGDLIDPGPPPIYEPPKLVTSKRYKGDPITGTETRGGSFVYPIWYDWTEDIGEYDSWFVVECQTENPALAAMGFSGLPKWQMKIQWDGRFTGAYADVSDPTGVKYPDYHGSDRCMLARMGAFGGWDLADVTPDFDPATPPLPAGVTPSLQNSLFTMGSGAADLRTQFVITAKGVVYVISTVSGGGKGFSYVGLIAGDVIPRTVASMPMPRVVYGNSWGQSGFGREDFLQAPAQYPTNRWFSYWDWNYDVKDRLWYYGNRRSSLVQAQSSIYDGFDICSSHPITVFPFDQNGMMFELSYMRQAWCSGGGQTTGNKRWLHPGYGWSAIFPWDGVTDPYEGY